ncbi:MAG: response regulator [Euryarchaeota archaeon]|nr:response regulator [Euryarchaeota archaeon]
MGKKILIVDDSELITYTVKDGLEELDPQCTVICVESGKQCIEYLEKNKTPDIILLDIMMPEMNGWEVCKAIRKNESWAKIPIVFLTAKTDNFSKGFGKIIAQEYIEKPFEVKDLKIRIDEILSKPFVVSDAKKKVVNDMLDAVPEQK